MAVTEATYALTSLEEVKSYGKITDSGHDVVLVQLINMVSARFEAECGRFFRSRSYVHDGTTLPRLDSYGGSILKLANAPVTAVSTLKIYPTASALVEGYAGDFVVHNEEGYIELLNAEFYTGSRIVECTYTGGYVDDPASALRSIYGWNVGGYAVQQAAIKQVLLDFYKRERSRLGVSSMSNEGMTIVYNEREWLSEISSVLHKYRRNLL